MPTGLQSLSNELLHEILEHLDADPERAVSFDRRAYLSVESFRPPERIARPRAHDIANFRLACRRFADLGASCQYTRVATRFSYRGFQRLEWIASQKHLARHAKKFSYLIPHFYVEGRTRIRDLLDDAEGELQVDPASLEAKMEAQRAITRSGEDSRILKKAMQAFTSLQHVQILRLQDEADSNLLEYLHENVHQVGFVDLKWPPACTHASQTIADALLEANSPVTRLSGPMMHPQSVVDMLNHSGTSLFPLAEKLTCLELHFDDAHDLNNRMRRLSPLFSACFRAARNMQALHLGFPSRTPLDLPFETIFNGVCWDRLRAFGVQAWRLHGNEILEFARAHSKTLRGLRLRDVVLRNGSRWKDVLADLRETMDHLEWVSLRRIDYEGNFDRLWASSIEVSGTGMPFGLESDSEESDEGNGFPGQLGANNDEMNHYNEDHDDESYEESNSGSDEGYDSASNADTDEGPQAYELDIEAGGPTLVAPNQQHQQPSCTCEAELSITAEEIGDNGSYVTYQHRKLWEKWVVGRCPVHE